MSSATALLAAPRFSDSAAGSLFSPTHTIVKERPEITEDDLVLPPQPVMNPPREKNPELSWESAERPIESASLASFGAEFGSEVRKKQQRVIKPEISQEAQQWLNGDLGLIHQRVMLFCIEEAKKMHVSVSSLHLSVKRSWEGEFRELVLQVYIDANFPQSLALWDSIGEIIQRWGERQPARRRRLLNEQYSVFVEPTNQS